jgi:hypothetical protein
VLLRAVLLAATSNLLRLPKAKFNPEGECEMPLPVKCLPVVALSALSVANTAHADEEMDAIIEQAMPHMHYSCASIIADYPDDEEAVAEIVRLMVAVSLFNRGIDVEKEIPDEANRTTLKDEFMAALEDACKADPDALLAGAVDVAVKDAVY